MPYLVKLSLESQWLWVIVKCSLAFLFLSSGLSKVLNVEAGYMEMRWIGVLVVVVCR